MQELEVLIGLILATTRLAALARRVDAPYPVFLALGGALLAFDRRSKTPSREDESAHWVSGASLDRGMRRDAAIP
jgi:monovalent cation/hydrogen antiporter